MAKSLNPPLYTSFIAYQIGLYLIACFKDSLREKFDLKKNPLKSLYDALSIIFLTCFPGAMSMVFLRCYSDVSKLSAQNSKQENMRLL